MTKQKSKPLITGCLIIASIQPRRPYFEPPTPSRITFHAKRASQDGGGSIIGDTDWCTMCTVLHNPCNRLPRKPSPPLTSQSACLIYRPISSAAPHSIIPLLSLDPTDENKRVLNLALLQSCSRVQHLKVLGTQAENRRCAHDDPILSLRQARACPHLILNSS